MLCSTDCFLFPPTPSSPPIDSNALFYPSSSKLPHTHLSGIFPSKGAEAPKKHPRPSSGKSFYMHYHIKHLTDPSSLRRCRSHDRFFKKENILPSKIRTDKLSRKERLKISPSKVVERKRWSSIEGSRECINSTLSVADGFDDVVDVYLSEKSKKTPANHGVLWGSNMASIKEKVKEQQADNKGKGHQQEMQQLQEVPQMQEIEEMQEMQKVLEMKETKKENNHTYATDEDGDATMNAYTANTKHNNLIKRANLTAETRTLMSVSFRIPEKETTMLEHPKTYDNEEGKGVTPPLQTHPCIKSCDPLQMAKDSVQEEIEELVRGHSCHTQPYIKYPVSITQNQKEMAVIRHVASTYHLHVEEGEKGAYVYKRMPDKSLSKLFATNLCTDLHVNMSNFKLGDSSTLQRLNSFKGNRRNMLCKLARTPTVEVPLRNEDCTNGVYMVKTIEEGSSIAMYKPIKEEKFNRQGIVIGEGAIREEAAYVLDSRGFSQVPPTTVASMHCSGSGAIQKFMCSTKGSLENLGMPKCLPDAETLVSVQEIQKIGILDVRLFNTDRHLGNILLLHDEPPYRLAPIDHGCILPSWYSLSEAQFGWLTFPQTKEPFTNESKAYIMELKIEEDMRKLRDLQIREECIATIKLCTLLLKMAVTAGKTLFWLGTFMMRSGCMENPSELEKMIYDGCRICHIPLVFEKNQYDEYESQLKEYGIVSRRPPEQFYQTMCHLFEKALKK